MSLRSTPDFAALRARMVERQLAGRGIHDLRVLAAMGRVPRELFVPPKEQAFAYEDAALPIGSGQTISQPYMVAATCELLALDGSERVLDVGTGSGYAAAVLAELAAEVVTVERLPELAARASAALRAAGYTTVDVRVGDGSLGVPDRAPFDAIAVAAAAPSVPSSLYEQLAAGGRIVVPVGTREGQRLVLIEHTPSGPSERRSIPCRYVPLLGEEGFPD
jgi:protein-L-isoaspartate(D-aspartate) O-methyltransferase